jgi:beta-galactosidase/beta-glucuronidase
MHIELAIIFLLILICTSTGAAEYRSSLSMDGKWDLYVPDRQQDYSITVPGSWEAQVPELRDYTGKATYSREFEVPEAWRGKNIFIKFGAVDYYADVFVNSVKVGSHEGGYTPFEFEIQDHIKFGETNTIKVDVVDPGPEHPVDAFSFEEIPHGKQSWYGNNSGIWQSACLEARNKSYIKSIVIDPDIDTATAQVKVNLANTVDGLLRLSIQSPKDAAHIPGIDLDIIEGHESISCKAKIPSPALWSPDMPALYSVKAELLVDGKVIDSLETSFGMRKIEAKDGKILLNNKPIFIAGALDQD